MNVYEIITERICEQLEKGAIPWRKPWRYDHKNNVRGATNLISKKAYRGVNAFMLAVMPYSSPYWVTFKQAQGMGGSVRKGEKSTPVVFWKQLEINETGEDGSKNKKRIPLLRYYNVFNVEQCEGVKDPSAVPLPVDAPPFNPIAECEAIVGGMPKRPHISHTGGKAFYNPLFDSVTMPAPERFDSSAEYYSTLFHELTHSTGHTSRIGREFGAAFGNEQYAKEELIAELGAAFLCGVAGIEQTLIENSAAYIANWLKQLKKDDKLIVCAAAAAQRSADYIRNVKFEERKEEAQELATV